MQMSPIYISQSLIFCATTKVLIHVNRKNCLSLLWPRIKRCQTAIIIERRSSAAAFDLICMEPLIYLHLNWIRGHILLSLSLFLSLSLPMCHLHIITVWLAHSWMAMPRSIEKEFLVSLWPRLCSQGAHFFMSSPRMDDIWKREKSVWSQSGKQNFAFIFVRPSYFLLVFCIWDCTVGPKSDYIFCFNFFSPLLHSQSHETISKYISR